ncbi:MAG TPA: plastocyanin/azurin family copper-binding protein, partial [Thermoanaerobaculia bacterium]
MRRIPFLAATLALAAAAALAAPAGADVFNVTVRDFVFVPADLTIEVGDAVVWTNTQGSHNVRADGGGFTSGAVQSGNWTFQHTFSSTGDFRYFCTLHGSAGGFGMSGIVRVTGGGGGGNVPGNLR